MVKKTLILIISLLSLLTLASFVSAQATVSPVAVDAIESVAPERKPTASGGVAVASESGNTTELLINGTAITQHWQGYYGNVTGEITLDDADSNTLFAWTLATPTGELFAVNGTQTVQWNNITCVNLTNTTSGAETTGSSKINASSLNQQFYISDFDVDNFTGTFTSTYDGADLQIGQRTITADNQCPSTFGHVNNLSQTTDFEELLLFDNDSSLVFTALLDTPGTTGFDGLDTHHFEMIVGQENGTIGNYYFYIELG